VLLASTAAARCIDGPLKTAVPAQRGTPCAAVWDVTGTAFPGSLPAKPWGLRCVDGDPSCDADGMSNGVCAVQVSVCIERPLNGCTPTPVSHVQVVLLIPDPGVVADPHPPPELADAKMPGRVPPQVRADGRVRHLVLRQHRAGLLQGPGVVPGITRSPCRDLAEDVRHARHGLLPGVEAEQRRPGEEDVLGLEADVA